MAEIKTKPTGVTVESFLAGIDDEKTRADSFTLMNLMEKVTGERSTMWGSAIIGYGKYHYQYASGREGEMCLVGFSPRKGKFALYGLASAPGQAELLTRLGKHKTGKGCLYITKLDDVSLDVLQSMIKNAFDYLKEKYNK